MLDGGHQLPTEMRDRVDVLRRTPQRHWDPDTLRLLKQPMSSDVSEVPLKYAFGSDFPYRDVDRAIPMVKYGVELSASLARGGLSNVWGSAALPYRAEDIRDWPIGVEDLSPHYEAVLSWLGLAAQDDGLSRFFPLYTDRYRPLAPSRQAAALLQDLRQSEARLNARGLHFGGSRLAVQPADCTYCGMCMFGCPYELIYCSASTLAALQSRPGFTYVGDMLVQRVVEQSGAVKIHGHTLSTGERRAFEAERVYLACGAISTTKILLESLEAFDQPVTLLDSAYFLLPLVRYRGTPGVRDEPLHTLAQVFLEIIDDATGPLTTHIQIYTFNELYTGFVSKRLRWIDGWWPWPKRWLLERLLIAQGFLHSALSQPIKITLHRTGEGAHRLELRPHGDPRKTREVIARVVKRLSSLQGLLRAVPASPLLNIASPGRSFHFGGTFPMRLSPQPFESDVFGRPHGFSRVHVADATSFPSVPATTITLTSMANAHRIASSYAQYEAN
jgi:choline dehydrogenase-like flavoprotein